MGETVDWSRWGDGLYPSLIAASIWVAILLMCGATLGRSRRSFYLGLAAAVVAYFLAVGANMIVSATLSATPFWLVFVVIPPLVEEVTRLTVASEVYEERHWLMFGAGYGAFEAGLKLGDLIALFGNADLGTVILLSLSPLVPFLLHVFLSVVVMMLLSRGERAWKIFAVAFAVHAAHNASVHPLLPTDMQGLVTSVVVRSVIFVALIMLVLRWGARGKPAPEAPLG